MADKFDITLTPDELIHLIYSLSDCPEILKYQRKDLELTLKIKRLPDKTGTPNQSLTMAYVQSAILKRLSLPERIENNKVFLQQ